MGVFLLNILTQSIWNHSQESISDMLDLQLEPYATSKGKTSLPPLHCPMLRTSGRVKIVSIKKYLVQRLGLKDTQSSVRHSKHFFEYLY
jgi:hypothetical protein